MADLGGLLGSMLATGMGGRSSRGAAFGQSPFGGGLGGLAGLGGLGGLGGLAGSLGGGLGGGGMGGLGGAPVARSGMGPGRAAGMAGLGWLAWKAFQKYGQQQPAPADDGQPAARSGGTGGHTASGPHSGSLGDRLSEMLRPASASAPMPDEVPEVEIEDERAMLLIRAMIAAANADGSIAPEERRTILAKLDQAGAGPEERRVIERELDSPRSLDQLLTEVKDPETAEQVYLASVMAIEPDTKAERTYLDYLASRLNLEPAKATALRQVTA